jgi:deoxyribonuclease-4
VKERRTEEGIRRVKELNLECMEIEFVRGVYLSLEKAKEIKKITDKEKITLTVHAPYFINLLSSDVSKVSASCERILRSAQIGEKLGAEGVVFHVGYYGGISKKEAYLQVKSTLKKLTSQLKGEGIKIKLCPETTGKNKQFGEVEEIIKLSEEIEGVGVCIDFPHIYARKEGRCNDYEEFNLILDKIESSLGEEVLKHLHIHLSGIEYGGGGERRHLNLKEDKKFRYQELIKVLKERKVGGMLIIESPNKEEDAMMVKEVYKKI